MAATAKHGTLVAATVTTVTLTDAAGGTLRVQNRHATSLINYTISKGGTAATPTSNGDDTFALPGGCTDALDLARFRGDGAVQVKLISAGTPDYSVEILP